MSRIEQKHRTSILTNKSDKTKLGGLSVSQGKSKKTLLNGLQNLVKKLIDPQREATKKLRLPLLSSRPLREAIKQTKCPWDYNDKKKFKTEMQALIKDPVAREFWGYSHQGNAQNSEAFSPIEILSLKFESQGEKAPEKSLKTAHEKLEKQGWSNPYMAVTEALALASEIESLEDDALKKHPMALNIALESTKIPQMNEHINALNSLSVSLGDMHGNAQLFLHKLVQTGYMIIEDAGAWNELNTLINKKEFDEQLDPEEFQKSFSDLLSQAISINQDAQKCKLRLLGDLLGDRGQNDLFTLEILKKLKEEKINYQIIFSNHDGEFLSWYHAGFDIKKVPKDNTMLLNGGKDYTQSLRALDVLCKENPQFKETLKTQIKHVYLSHLTLLDLGRGGILYSHAPVGAQQLNKLSQEVLPKKQWKGDTSQQIKNLNDWFSKVKEDKDLFYKTFRKEMVDGQPVAKGLMAFVDFNGKPDSANGIGKNKEKRDMALSKGVSHSYHGHKEALKTQDKNDTFYANFDEYVSRYTSLDGGVGQPKNSEGLRFFFAIPDWRKGGVNKIKKDISN